MADLPTGTITFLYTDIEESTKRWETHPDAMKAAVERHDVILRNSIQAHGGIVFRTMGDAFCAAFPTAPQALDATLAVQHALFAEEWNETGPIKVRIALHTGLGEVRDGDYVGQPLNRVARLLATGHGGQTLLSQVTCDLVRDNLPPGVILIDLGEHRLKDLQRPERVFQLAVDDLPAEFPPLKTLGNHPNNLPIERSPIIGREKELAAIAGLLMQDDVGLLTLTGPGGTGKTRSALQVAADLIERFPDGVFFVPLAPVGDPELVIPTIAQTLGVRETGGQPLLETLKSYLLDKRILLVLDNLEQVLPSAPIIAQLVSSAPWLKVLVTSRAKLHVHGEREFPIPPLSLPDPKNLPDLQNMTQYEAVRLFIERAVAVKPDFEVTNDNAPAVAEICARLDGLPLAIELAAARIKVLSPKAMLVRLQSRLTLLTTGGQDLPTRQQTLRGAIEWGYDLLNQGEQTLFRRLSVFAGVFLLESTEAICSGVGSGEWGVGTKTTPYSPLPTPLGIDVLDGLESLVDKSLLRIVEQEDEELGFLLLETIREFALEKLEESGEGSVVRQQHARYFMNLAEQAEPELHGRNQAKWLGRLDAEQDDIRAALAWSIEQQDAETALRLGSALWHFWRTHGYLSEGRKWLEDVLSLDASTWSDQVRARATRAKALYGLAILVGQLNDQSSARTAAEESVAIFRELGEKLGLAWALSVLGVVNQFLGESAAAGAYAEESVALLREVGGKWDLALALMRLGMVRNGRGDYVAAHSSVEESLGLFRSLGDKWGISQSLNMLGDIARLQGDYSRAEPFYEESLALYREMDTKRDIPASLQNLGHVALAHGNHERAENLFKESLILQRELDNRQGIAESLDGLAGVAGAQGRPVRAARLFGAAEALQESVGGEMWPTARVDYERNLAIARAELDEAAWEVAWTEGRAMVLGEQGTNQAVEFALEDNPQ